MMKINLKTMLLLAGVSLIVSVPCALAHTDVTAEEAKAHPMKNVITRSHLINGLCCRWFCTIYH